jgi:hypothetical protein
MMNQLRDPNSKLMTSSTTSQLRADQVPSIIFVCPIGMVRNGASCAKCHGDKYAAKVMVIENGDVLTRADGLELYERVLNATARVQCESCPHDEVPNTRGDGCVCAAGFYDAWQGEVPASLDVPRPMRLEVYCWEQEMAEDPTKSRLNQNNQVDKEGGKGRCVECPGCVACDRESWDRERRRVAAAEAAGGRGATKWTDRVDFDPEHIVEHGFGLLEPHRLVPRSGRVDLFKCKANASCLSFDLLAPYQNRTMCKAGHSEGSRLCGVCSEDYSNQGGNCQLCGELTPGSLIMLIVVLVGVALVSLVRLQVCTPDLPMVLVRAPRRLAENLTRVVAWWFRDTSRSRATTTTTASRSGCP